MAKYVYAPIVKATQPIVAREERSTVQINIYFSLSAFNTLSDIEWVRYTLVDPNKNAVWGNNSMLKFQEEPSAEFEDPQLHTAKYHDVPRSKIFFNESKQEYYFTITAGGDDIEALISEQYYQMQMVFLYYNEQRQLCSSQASQATLVRVFEGFSSIAIEGLGTPNTMKTLGKPLKTLKGNLTPRENNSVEYIQQYRYEIAKESSPNNYQTKVFSSDMIDNSLLFDFDTKIGYFFEEEVAYKLTFYFTTIHGYTSSYSYYFKISDEAAYFWEEIKPLSLVSSSSLGYIQVSIKLLGSYWSNIENNKVILDGSQGTITLQRAEYAPSLYWQDISSFRITVSNNETISLKWYDYLLQGGEKYCYRIEFQGLDTQGSKITVKQKNFDTQTAPITDTIFLSDSNMMLAIQYNPVISNLKWVTQESLVNTLGGKYPIIRRNGAVKYKQFTLNGSLFFDVNPSVTMDAFDSVKNFYSNINDSVLEWFKPQACGLYFANGSEQAVSYFSNDKFLIETKLKNIATEFLANGKLKFFNSTEEGPMIVYLSNISFTPNKTLGRHIYDFSATVTEVAETNEENLRKYQFIASDPATSLYTSRYKISIINAVQNESDAYYTAFLDSNVLIGNLNDSATIKIQYEEVKIS